MLEGGGTWWDRATQERGSPSPLGAATGPYLTQLQVLAQPQADITSLHPHELLLCPSRAFLEAGHNSICLSINQTQPHIVHPARRILLEILEEDNIICHTENVF